MASTRRTADALFATQVAAAVVSGIAQFVRLRATTQGVSVSWYASWDAFLLITLGLSLRAHRAQPSRLTSQTIATYGVWLAMVTAQIAAMTVGRRGVWDGHDATTVALAGIGVAAAAVVSVLRGRGVFDPYARGAYALCLRAVPQCALAWRLWSEGHGGFPGLTLVMGHIAILTRIGQVWLSIREAGWDRNRIGAAIAEAGNEASWCAITVAWLAR